MPSVSFRATSSARDGSGHEFVLLTDEHGRYDLCGLPAHVIVTVSVEDDAFWTTPTEGLAQVGCPSPGFGQLPLPEDIPEPSTLVLLGLGVLAVAVCGFSRYSGLPAASATPNQMRGRRKVGR